MTAQAAAWKRMKKIQQQQQQQQQQQRLHQLTAPRLAA
jgi:hypothetical protein